MLLIVCLGSRRDFEYIPGIHSHRDNNVRTTSPVTYLYNKKEVGSWDATKLLLGLEDVCISLDTWNKHNA